MEVYILAKERLFDLPETKGIFQIRGLVTGHDKDNFYKESKTKTGKTMRRTSFGVTFEPNKTMYVSMQGFPQNSVYFSSPGKNGEKGTTEKVEWADRFTFKKEGFRLIGNNIGVTKATNEKGELENVRKTLTDFDAVKEITDHLKDNDSVFIKGKLDYSSFTTENGEVHSVKLVPNQVSLCKAPIDFDDEKFEPNHQFTQVIVFTGIEQEKEDDKPTGRFIVSANIVNYASVEDAEFIIEDKNLANTFRKGLSPYNAIQVYGDMSVTEVVEEVDDDVWGEANRMNVQTTPVKREYIIRGAKPSTIDKETYSEVAIAEAKLKVKNANDAKADFGSMTTDTSSDADWGSVPTGSDEDEDIPW